jgi:hypothetical protein
MHSFESRPAQQLSQHMTRASQSPEMTAIQRDDEARALARALTTRVSRLPSRTTPAVRTVRREFSRRIATHSTDVVLKVAHLLLDARNDILRFVAYELVAHHPPTFDSLRETDVLALGQGLDSWSSVDCFAMYLSGPLWLRGRIARRTITTWARDDDRWWRRAALVSTVALSRDGGPTHIQHVLGICGRLTSDRDDMVVKALSWAVRELAKTHPLEARRFLAANRPALAARVVREVSNKLETGLKTPRRLP